MKNSNASCTHCNWLLCVSTKSAHYLTVDLAFFPTIKTSQSSWSNTSNALSRGEVMDKI